MEATVIPLPTELTTPPVTNIKRVIELKQPAKTNAILHRCKTSVLKKKPWNAYSFQRVGDVSSSTFPQSHQRMNLIENTTTP